MASIIQENATWRDDKLQIATNVTDPYRFDVRIPSPRDVAWRLLQDGRAQSSLSDKGRTAVRLLELRGYEVLLDGNARRAIEALRTRGSKDLLRELRRRRAEGQPDDDLVDLALQWGGRQQRRFRSVEQLRSAEVSDGAQSAELLCQQDWAERGFSIKCEICSVRSFVSMEQTQPKSICPACQAPQPYEVDDDDAPAIQYRLQALIDHAADQGVLPHVMAIAALRKRHERTFLIPGADVEFADGPPREVDLFGIHDGSVVSGEAKTSPAGHDVADLEADIGLTAALGADTHLMVAIGDIAEPAVEQAKQLTQAANLGLILIQGEHVTYVNQDG